MLSKIIILFSILFIAKPIYGHGDLHERIKKVTDEIKSHPDSAYLYLKRGELLFQHEKYKKSIRDFKTCSKLGLTSNRLELGFAESYERNRKLEKSLTHLNKVLVIDANNVKALRLKGRVLMKMGQYAEAGTCYEKVIQYAEKTIPENYLEASNAWGNSPGKEGPQNAIEAIMKGINELGELTAFLDRMIELYIKYEDYEMALSYQAKIIDKANRKENAYYKRALIYLEIGDEIAAKSDLENSMKAINILPMRIKNNQAMMDLKSDVNKILKML